MLFIGYINISPGFILINSIQEKYQKKYNLICSNICDDVMNFEICGFMRNTNI